jgi:hypothetical protein
MEKRWELRLVSRVAAFRAERGFVGQHHEAVEWEEGANMVRRVGL